MGKALGIMALVFGLVTLGLSPLLYFDWPVFLRFVFGLPAIGLGVGGLVCGGIGIAKDDGPGLAIAGLVISSVAMINFIAGITLNIMGITG